MPPLAFVFEDPKREWGMWDIRLAKAVEIYDNLMVGGVPIPKNADKDEVMNEASPEDLLTLVQTGGMVRRQDRRDTRQDCRHQEGAVGMDKRNCKQVRRQQRSSSPQTPNTGPPKS